MDSGFFKAPGKVVSNAQFATRRETQNGALLPLFALVVFGAIGVVTLLMDLSRQELAAVQLQQAADAAALAAVQEINGSAVTYAMVVKQQAIDNLRKQTIYGLASQLPADFALDQTTADLAADPNYPVLSDPLWVEGGAYNHRSNVGVAENLVVQVDRGIYRWDAARGEKVFESLEYAQPEAGPQASNGQGNVLDPTMTEYNAPASAVANAVRVSLTLRELPTMFAGVFGAEGFDQIVRTSVATINSKTEACVLPLAIPLCSLMVNTDPRLDDVSGGKYQYQTFGYLPQDTCKRDLTFAEANREETPFRRDGFFRSAVYPRPPCLPDDPACQELNDRGVPLRGVLGLPEGARRIPPVNPDVTSAEELGMFFKDPRALGYAQGNCPAGMISVSIGQRFLPVDDLVDGEGLPLPGFLDDEQTRDKLVQLIQGETDFNKPFFDPEHGFEKPAEKGNLANFPFMRRYRKDLPGSEKHEMVYSWPSYYTWMSEDPSAASPIGYIFPFEAELFAPVCEGAPEPLDVSPRSGKAYVTAKMYLDPEPNGNWTNPMCHDAGVPANDPDEAKVRVATAMVIVPDPNSGANYCDWTNVFHHGQQDSRVPAGATRPLVVGFVKVNLFDFNVMKLDRFVPPRGLFKEKRPELPSATPRYDCNAAGKDCNIVDRGPLGIEKVNMPACMSGYPRLEDNKTELKPIEDPFGECTQLCEGEEDPEACLESCAVRPALSEVCDNENITDSWYCMYRTLRKCFVVKPVEEREPLHGELADINRSRQKFGMHCMPMKVNDCTPADDPECWEMIQPRQAQYGCGGIRARVSCEDVRGGEGIGQLFPLNSFANPDGFRWSVPSLVKG